MDPILLNAGKPGIIWTILVSAVAFFLGAYLLKGVELKGFVSALIVAAVISLLNATVGRILDVISIPITFITLGLFKFVIDALMIMVADYFLEGFKVKSFGWALLLAVIVAVVNMILFGIIS